MRYGDTPQPFPAAGLGFSCPCSRSAPVMVPLGHLGSPAGRRPARNLPLPPAQGLYLSSSPSPSLCHAVGTAAPCGSSPAGPGWTSSPPTLVLQRGWWPRVRDVHREEKETQQQRAAHSTPRTPLRSSQVQKNPEKHLKKPC